MRYTILLVLLIFLVGCLDSISEIKSDEYIGREVAVRGNVENTLKIGDLSGYTLVGEDGEKISVSSEILPREGDKVTVKGILQKRLITGYYIETKE